MLFLITMALIGASVIAIERADRQARAAELDRNAIEISSGLERRASESVAMLSAAAALFSSQEITPRHFQTMATDIYNRGQTKGTLGIGWAPILRLTQTTSLETDLRDRGELTGEPKFAIHPQPKAGQRYIIPVVHVMPPSAMTQPAIGLDMYSEPIRREAIMTALHFGEPVASGRLTLATSQTSGPMIGFLIYVPVYREPDDHRRPSAFVFSPIVADAFLDSAAELYRQRGVEVALYDGHPEPDRLLASRPLPGAMGDTLDRPVTIAHRHWVLRISTKRTQLLTLLSRVTLVLGTLLALLVMYTARVITRRALEDRRVLESLRQQATIRTQLTRELNHRVKNTLANVLSIVSLTRRRASDLDEFADSLTARLRALSATHDLLGQTNWTEALIAEIVRSEIAPYLQVSHDHVTMSGPAISLAPNDALSLGLALHELATNAAKYGALSVPEGHIDITWSQSTPDLAHVHWRESGGPVVTVPTKRGFGRDLIEKIVSHELRSQVELSFKPEGVQCRLAVPVRRTAEFEIRNPSAAG